MDYKKKTSHFVKQFNEKTIDSKHCIDLVPISWTYMKDSKLYCKYPSKKEYALIDKMSKSLSEPKKSWKGFGISIMKEEILINQNIFILIMVILRYLLTINFKFLLLKPVFYGNNLAYLELNVISIDNLYPK